MFYLIYLIMFNSIRTNTQHPETTMPHHSTHPNSSFNKTAINLPRPIIPSSDSIYNHDKISYRNNQFAFPPAQSLYRSDNSYDAGPQFFRPTSATILNSPKKRQFPYGAWIMPFGSSVVPQVKVQTPFRCTRCKGYVNPYFRLNGLKNSTQCNLCGITLELQEKTIKESFLNPIIGSKGVVDLLVQDQKYATKKSDVIKIIIAIEIGQFMYESGIFANIIAALRAAIQSHEFEDKVKIGFIFYNENGIHFLKLRKENWGDRAPIKYTVPNNKSGCCFPLSDKEMLFDPNHQKQKLLFLLDKLQEQAYDHYHNGTYGMNNINYALIIRAILSNNENQTGRIMLFANNAPRTGLHALKVRNVQQNSRPLKPLNRDFEQLGKDLLQAKIGVDLYLFSKEHVVNHELSTVHFMASSTGGSVYLYSAYSHENNSENLFYTVFSNLTKQYVYDVSFAVRMSYGLNIRGYEVGDGFHPSRSVSLSIMDPASSLAVFYDQTEKVQESRGAFLQYAVLFTTGNGLRKIRLINYKYGITAKVEVLHEACDYLAFCNVLCREHLNKLCLSDPPKVREELMNRLMAILAEYCQNAQYTLNNSQFFAHNNLAPAFAYLNSIMNSRLFVNWNKSSADFRMWEILKIRIYGFSHFGNRYYPKLYPLTLSIYEQGPTPGDYLEDQDQIAVIPPNIPLHKNEISPEGLYLSHTPQYLVILVQERTPQQLLMELFGSDDWQEIQKNSLLENESAHNIRVNVVVNELRRRNTEANGIYLPLLVRTPLRPSFHELMRSILKETHPESNYYQFLNIIHQHVQKRIK